MTGESRVD